MVRTENILHQLKEKGVEVHFNKVGEGDKVVFTFPGVGMDERYFTRIFREKEKQNIFYHFHIKVASYKYKYEIPALWIKLISALIEENQIRSFDIVAYSIGARLSYSLFGREELHKVTLICPDGIVEHPIYRLVTQTLVGSIFFRPAFCVIRYIVPNLSRYIKLSSLELFNIWKLYSVFKFPKKVENKVNLFLAKNDLLVSNKKVLKRRDIKGFWSVEEVNASHFSILYVLKNKLKWN